MFEALSRKQLSQQQLSQKQLNWGRECLAIRPAAPWAAILALLLFSGCASWEPTYPDSRPAPPPNPWPVPTETTPQPDGSENQPDYSESAPPSGQTGTEPSAPETGPRPTVTPSAPAPYGRKPATIALAQQANQQASEGELDSAAATLERALRIDRRDARLWQQLATVRIGQGRAKQAEALLKKSNALANGDTALQSQNWRYIAQARESLGDRQGAGAALENARDLRAGG